MSPSPSPQAFADYVSHEDFQAGMAAGRMRVIINPKLARRFVSQRLLLMVFLLPLIGVGVVLALAGKLWLGGGMVALGVIINRALMYQAGKIALHLALRDPNAYDAATQNGVMEVRPLDVA
ncbi:hypothetical protein QTH91_11905 [Variovorax dokdonensis]|uniref:Uncharacterized protein n=1 Tax=Variovorax dokdonensis TaxID=344883 RepID=A0ABT7NBC0_9BURK|nr:hypothetical protein [Variovorax dokdonensis]MDM0045190.1 hypothetical protein [Variovorax dokdonensis]